MHSSRRNPPPTKGLKTTPASMICQLISLSRQYKTEQNVRNFYFKTRAAGAASPMKNRLIRRFCLAGSMVLALAGSPEFAGQTNSPSTNPPTPMKINGALTQDFQAARTLFLSNTSNTTNAWRFARACFYLSERTTNNVTKADIAE